MTLWVAGLPIRIGIATGIERCAELAVLVGSADGVQQFVGDDDVVLAILCRPRVGMDETEQPLLHAE